MSYSLPFARHPTCLLASTGSCGLWLSRLKRSGQVGRRQVVLSGSEAQRDQPVTTTLLALLTECQIIHYDTAWALGVLNDILDSQGLPHISSPVHDIAPFVRRILAGSTSAPLDLMDIPGLCGRIPSAPSLAQEKVPPSGRILEMVYSRLVRPRLGSGIDLESDRHATSRDCDPIESTDSGQCLSIPPLPDIPPPAGGWRTDPWLAPEARDVALRFSGGASLSELSLLTGRSARAILARLQIDQVVKHS